MKSENFLKKLEGLNETSIYVLTDKFGSILDINDMMSEKTGYDNSVFFNKNIKSIFPEEYSFKIDDVLKEIVSKGEIVFSIPLIDNMLRYLPIEAYSSIVDIENKKYILHKIYNLPRERFFEAFDLSNSMMSISTIEKGKYIDVNQRFLEELDYEKEEVVGFSSREVGFIGFEYNRAEFIKKLKRGALDNYQVSLTKKDKSQITCICKSAIIKLSGIEYLFFSATNITNQIETLRRSEYLFNQQKVLSDVTQLLGSGYNLSASLNSILKIVGEHTGVSRVYIFENDSSNQITSNTYEWCNEFITPQIELLQNTPYEIIPSWKELLLNNGFIFSENISELPQDIRDVLEPQEIKSILIYPITVEGNFYGFIGFDECKRNKIWEKEELALLKTVSNVLSNSFERREYLERLKSSEIRLKMAIESANEALWDWNFQSGELYLNENWYKMSGYTSEELSGLSNLWYRFIDKEDLPNVIDNWNRHISGETEFYEQINRIVTKEGSKKWVITKGMVVKRDKDGNPLRAVGIQADITEQKEREEELRKLVATRDMYFSIIAHDLRGPIGSFAGLTEMMNTSLLDKESEKEIISELAKLSKSTFELLENLLIWARSQRGDVALNLTQINLSTLVEIVLSPLKTLAQQKNILLINEVKDGTTVFADSEALSLIIRNIVSNSIKFTKSGGRVLVSSKKRDSLMEISIIDNGIGMPKEVADRLFTSDGYQTRRGTDNEKGSGLGLMMSSEFVKRMGGEIKVESIENIGTRVFFTVPVK
ncbi:MAG: PAS domain S-box protein [Bacteroidales bacterium]